MINHIEFPSQNEYPVYAEMYMKLVKKDGSLIEQLKSSLDRTKTLINNLSNEELDYRYEKNKWSIKITGVSEKPASVEVCSGPDVCVATNAIGGK